MNTVSICLNDIRKDNNEIISEIFEKCRVYMYCMYFKLFNRLVIDIVENFKYLELCVMIENTIN